MFHVNKAQFDTEEWGRSLQAACSLILANYISPVLFPGFLNNASGFYLKKTVVYLKQQKFILKTKEMYSL